MRARLALQSSRTVCELREITLRNKPAEMIAASPKATVPVLITGGGNEVLEESLDIMLWALAWHDPEGWLSHTNAEALELIQHMDGPFKKALDGYKYAPRPSKRVQPDAEAIAKGEAFRAEGFLHLQNLEMRLSQQSHLMGENFGLADAAIAPFVRQFAHVDLDWYHAQPLPHVHAWLNTITNSYAFNSIMKKLDVWESGTKGLQFPFQEAQLKDQSAS